MKRLESKVAIVTGATSGIGAAIARLYAAEGAKVAVVGRNESRGREVVETIATRGGEAIFVAADVSVDADCRRMVESTVERFGTVDVLVNNAGTTSTVAVEDADEAEFERIIGTNLKAVYLATKYVIPIMKRNGRGVVLTVSSKGAIIPTHCSAIYAASKAGAAQLTQAIAVNYGKFGIRANVLYPSYIDTPMTDEYIARAGKDYRQAISELAEETPLGRIGTSEDCAYAALFLASDEASFISGSPMLIDGGVIFS